MGLTPSYITAFRYSVLLLIIGISLFASAPESGFNSPLMSCCGLSSDPAIAMWCVKSICSVSSCVVSVVRMLVLVGEHCDVIVQADCCFKFGTLSNAQRPSV